MPPSSIPRPLGHRDRLKTYSCLSCRKRKVRCDRRDPCSNCVRAGKQGDCSFVAPVRGKRKRTRPPREGLHAKLRRYEKLLKSHGVKIEPEGDRGLEYSSEPTSQPGTGVAEDGSRSVSRGGSHEAHDTSPKLVAKENSSRYFDSAPWSSLEDELQHPEVGTSSERADELSLRESRLFFGSDDGEEAEDASGLYPSLDMLPQLRDVYVDRVDPLVKIFHVPTFWAMLDDRLRQNQGLPKDLEAAMLAVCLAVVSSLPEDECREIFQMQKSTLRPRYASAVRRALTNAGFLSSSSLMTLRAFALFMMCTRNVFRCDALFVLSGVAIRLARKMGLHRNGASLGLPPFEAEMRRRLWWHLVHVDFRTADVLGLRPSLDLSCGDAGRPLNADDEDLGPGLAHLPPERGGITAITFCLIRCEMMEALRKLSTTWPADVRWEALSSPDVALAKKDGAIAQLEDQLERKYLRHCDPSVPLHSFISILTRSSICKMKLFAHSPRQFAGSTASVSQSERNVIFDNATRLLEYAGLMQQGGQGLDRYRWQLGATYLWNSVLYVLIEVRHLKTGPEVDRAWRAIGELLPHHPPIFQRSPEPVYAALGNWTLQAWDDYVAASGAEGLPEPTAPEYIDTIRRCRRPSTESGPRGGDQAVSHGPAPLVSSGTDGIGSRRNETDASEFGSVESFDFSALTAYDMDFGEWMQWERWATEQGGLAHSDGL
ncbi:hypothetical protein CDD83_7934 [Cordyceps sp. RAO-2017]|nr:hypothetical protein CDD83_7934 [Cordyceps sp. RAO-2017]